MFPRKDKTLIEAVVGEKRERNINAIRKKNQHKKKTNKQSKNKEQNQKAH